MVICDACVLINLAVVERFDLLAKLEGYRFCAAQAAMDEVVQPREKAMLAEAITAGWLEAAYLNCEREDSSYRELYATFDNGESATLALAEERQWMMATDETGALTMVADSRLGAGRRVNTVWILLQAIRQGLMDVEEADQLKRQLERNHFAMIFASFGDLL